MVKHFLLHMHSCTTCSKRAKHGNFLFIGGTGTFKPNSSQKNWSKPSFCLQRESDFDIQQISNWSQTIGWTSCKVFTTDSRAAAKLISSTAAIASSSMLSQPSASDNAFFQKKQWRQSYLVFFFIIDDSRITV